MPTPSTYRRQTDPMRPHRRAILSLPHAAEEPQLPPGLEVLARRRVSRSATGPGETAGFVDEFLIAGDALDEVAEMCEPPRLSLEELRLAAAEHAS